MTIGIGFKCNDGIVIAADTQYTRGPSKSHGPKIFPLFVPDGRPDLAVVVVGAGTVGFMKRAVENIEAALVGCSGPTLKDVQAITEAELLDFYKTHIYPSPGPQKPDFELILGIWTKVDGFGLLKTEKTIATPAAPHGSGYCSIGLGQYVSEYALGLTYPAGGPTVEGTKLIAAFCVKAAKDYVDYCGGKTKIWTLKRDGPGVRVYRMLPVEVADAEQYSEDLFVTLRYILQCLDPEASPGEDSVGLLTDILRDGVLRFRNKQAERREKIREAREKAKEPAIQKATITPPQS